MKEALVDKGEEFSGRGSYPVFFNFTKGDGKPAPICSIFVISALGEQKHRSLRKFKASLVYMMSSRPARAT